MRYHYIIIFVICIILILVLGCEPKEQEPLQPTIQPQEQPTCTKLWICKDGNTRAYRNADCAFTDVTNCPNGCESGECKTETPKKESKEIKEETIKTSVEVNEGSEKIPQEIQQILGYSKTRLKSYSYKYKSPEGPQYNIYVKGNKIRIDPLSSTNTIYLDAEKKTAEEYCISHSICGRQVGKVADLNYGDAYIETPVDWVAKITEAKKVDEGSYLGKKSWELSTNIGEVMIDSYFGFIFDIKQNDTVYSFIDASFNVVQDSDVNIPEYMLPGRVG